MCIPTSVEMIYSHILRKGVHNNTRCIQLCHYYSSDIHPQIFSDERKTAFLNRLSKSPVIRGVKPSAFKNAAILVPLCTFNGIPSVLFTLRSPNIRRHRGQVSFPGGMTDKTDKDFIHTAIRETEEEIGITASKITVWGEMKPLPTREGDALVVPVVAHIGEVNPSELKINPREVELIFTRTIQSLCDPKNWGITQMRLKYGYTLPVFLGGEHRIWGLTAVCLHILLLSLVPEVYNFNVHHQGMLKV
ncbi:nucleoside diphosphate-linked moiety X motif 8-like isoform X2 [Limulus polyphemus]|nr:nucleoside diphosphate-linked moiety X motif 8-like isoform X2 [Limulus polyphemus]